jgi:hypothetical protein
VHSPNFHQAINGLVDDEVTLLFAGELHLVRALAYASALFGLLTAAATALNARHEV